MTETRRMLPEADLSEGRHQYLENLATGYWHSEVLFAALELQLFDLIEERPATATELARAGRCHAAPLGRLLAGLEGLGLVRQQRGTWINADISRDYLLSNRPEYLGDFLLYRRYLQHPWRDLVRRVAEDPDAVTAAEFPGESYADRNMHYVRSLDALARRKGEEIFGLLAREPLTGPVLDAGGGAGALCRCAVGTVSPGVAVLVDLPEVLAAARTIYPDPTDWQGIHPVAADIRFSFPFSVTQRFGLVILSNVLHGYDAPEARALLDRAARHIAPGGLLLIHDYFPNAQSAAAKGALYDLNMMLNTQNGRCHRISIIGDWLSEAGFDRVRIRSLPSDSALILAGGRAPADDETETGIDDLILAAIELGFVRAVPIDPENIVTAPWVRVKCRFGCPQYDQGLACPPHGRDATETAALLKCYGTAILLEGEPPDREFHSRLLALENRAFLSGHPKALAFGAGPCLVCDDCPEDGNCRCPEKARPSMAASGIDVFTTARSAGIPLSPVPRKGDHVRYIGLLLVG